MTDDYGTPTTAHVDFDELWHYCQGTWLPGSAGLCSDGIPRTEHVVHLTSTEPRKGPIPDGQSRAAREGA